MSRILTTLSLACSVALASPLMAQQTDQTAEPAPATTETQPSGTTSQLDLGQPVSDGPQLGERYSKEKFGDWDLACIRTEAERDPCSLLQILRDENDNPLAEISLFRLKNAGQAVAAATVVVPLETLLTAQLTIAVDGGSAKRYNYSFCSPLGCAAQIGLTEADINAFKRGNAATVTIVPAPAPDQKVTARMSLAGFTAGYNVVDEVEN